MATASVGATTSRALEPQSDPSPKFLSEASSSSRTAEAEARQVWCHDGADADVLDLDSPWVAAAEAESRLEEAAMAAAAAGLRLHAEGEADEDEIRNNQERQDDEVWYAD
jgi:E3 ubiquitin-protein ligase RNF14